MKGKMEYHDKRIYNGEFKNGKMHGEGELEWVGGKNFKGTFQDGLMHDGVLANEDGSQYKGAFDEEEKEHGEGTYTLADSIYKGVFDHGVPGKGTITYEDSYPSDRSYPPTDA